MYHTTVHYILHTAILCYLSQEKVPHYQRVFENVDMDEVCIIDNILFSGKFHV